MDVSVVGSGPAVEAVEAAMADVEATVEQGSVDTLADATFGVVVGDAGDAVFRRANETARDADTPWLAVELGGIGGLALSGVDAAIAELAPDAGCFDCVATRVAATTGEDELVESADTAPADARLAGAMAGCRLAGLVGGEAEQADASADFGGRVTELPHAERRFLPVPGCGCGTGRDRTLAREYAAVDLETAVDRAERTLDERLGIVATIGEVESFPAPYYLAQSASTAAFSDVTAPQQAAGVDADWEAAFMKAIGEGLERYAAGVYRSAEFRSAPPGAVEDAPGPEVVAPDAFVRPDDAAAVDPEEQIPWVPGADLTTGEEALLPAEFVHFPPPSERFAPAITTGLGLGTSQVGALLSGLYETVERDATMLAWYSTFDPLELAVDDDGYDTLRKRARAEDLATTALLVTQDVDVPVVAAAVHREDGDWPRFAAGSAADLDPVAAARSALAEALQNWMELRSMGPEGASNEAAAIGRYADFPAEARSFLDAGGPVPAAEVGPDEPPSGVDELDALCARVADADLTPYAVRLTTRDLERAGLEAVRVLVPGAQPLFTGDPFFGERARTVPKSLGFEPRLDRAFHPYP